MSEPLIFYGLESKATRPSLARFVANVLNDGMPRGSVYEIGIADRVIARDMRKKGSTLVSNKIAISDNTILKYIGHAKNEKGAALNFKEYWKLTKLVNKPTHVYEDRKQKYLTYVITMRYSSGRVLKAVVHPNYKSKNGVYNSLKSVGIVDKVDMKGRQYRKIK